MARVAVIGSGFSGLSAACFAARAGHQVSVFEQNAQTGGRARSFSSQGFTFDMGPSWYWMPDIFERFFSSFGKEVSDYYTLKQLDPGFQIVFGKDDVLPIPAGQDELYALFEQVERGSADRLKKFLGEARFKYRIGMEHLVYKPSFSLFELLRADVLKGLMRANIFTSVSGYVRKYFKDKRLIDLMEFPVLFLGAMPQRIPALYTLMNYAALVQGTHYPMGGMVKIIEALESLAVELGIRIHTSTKIDHILVDEKRVSGLLSGGEKWYADSVVASADYHHVEQKLLPREFQNYSEQYWSKRTFAPSCLIFYIGVRKKIPGLLHHNLYFDTDFDLHSKEIYRDPKWPSAPLFYVCCPSKTDDSVAPEGMENLFVLVPVATGLNDNESIREFYFSQLVRRIEQHTGIPILDDIVYKKSYCINDFVNDYNAYKGNAYGLANTLNQTAVLKPSLKSKKLPNLFYAGQLTVPGPGVPPSLISGQIAAQQVIQYLKKRP